MSDKEQETAVLGTGREHCCSESSKSGWERQDRLHAEVPLQFSVSNPSRGGVASPKIRRNSVQSSHGAVFPSNWPGKPPNSWVSTRIVFSLRWAQ